MAGGEGCLAWEGLVGLRRISITELGQRERRGGEFEKMAKSRERKRVTGDGEREADGEAMVAGARFFIADNGERASIMCWYFHLSFCFLSPPIAFHYNYYY